MHRVRNVILVAAGIAILVSTVYVYAVASRDQTTASSATATAPLRDVKITRGDLVQKLDVAGTLEGTPLQIPATAESSGVLTSMPEIGATVSRGQPLFRINNLPVVLLYGSTPPWRSFRSGMSPGPDVKELESNLLALGYGQRFGLVADGDYAAADAKSIAKFAKAEALSEANGTLAFGSVIFEPGPVVVTGYATPLGGNVSPGVSILQIEGRTSQLVAQVDASQGTGIHIGGPGLITLASATQPVAATVSAVGSSPPVGASGSSSSSVGNGG